MRWRTTCVVLCAWPLNGTVLKDAVVVVVVVDLCAELVGAATAAPEIDGWTTIGPLLEEEEVPIVGAADDGALADEPDDEDE